MIKNKTINAEELGYVSPRAKVIKLEMSHSLLQDNSIIDGSFGNSSTEGLGEDDDDPYFG